MLNYKMLPEQELVQAYIQGADAAITELVNRTQDKVYTVVYYLVKDKYLTEDIVQDTYMRAVKKMKEGAFANDGKLISWLSRIARNLCMDYFRGQAVRQQKVRMIGDKDVFEYISGTQPNKEDDIMLNQSRNRVVLMLDLLPQEQKEVIVMRLFAEMSFKEIAEETNTTINTSLGRMRYGLMNLRKIIKEKELVL
jgi:RNA polymerase sigma factor (sigma-70 family)